MPKITFVQHDGSEQQVEIPVGYSIMEGAVKSVIPGIDADCGGACACATCHVYIEPGAIPGSPPKSDVEQAMLDFANDVTSDSRLSCQVMVTADMEGLIVKLPRSQRD